MLEGVVKEFLGEVNEIVSRACEMARQSLGEGSHGLEHTERVLRLALRIGREEGAELEVVALAAILHDIARPLEDAGKIEDHAAEGARIARQFLGSLGYSKAEKVAHAIEAHRFSGSLKPRTLEAKILSDADKLDAIGAIGIARVFMYSGEHRRGMWDSIRHFEEKILKLRNLMYTETARRIAEERHRFTEEFLKRLKMELRGKA
ncbi:HD domain-containing protein [Pyrococcus yayanosii]|uniref:Metal-dependent phosphohydrolase, HD superfamily n=1 Tax=Pyrococcus yayanosii (strain CH1 / JCM 16557) TaxID=529709 RepID=F8AFL3_PYRYC|nr:HD domain-containing protein [Pyrococcus yayanosii]AEH24979.1 metal-dependent phosphohydrolase, HD superfamily [Pyrococcus yayanosii CH1]